VVVGVVVVVVVVVVVMMVVVVAGRQHAFAALLTRFLDLDQDPVHTDASLSSHFRP